MSLETGPPCAMWSLGDSAKIHLKFGQSHQGSSTMAQPWDWTPRPTRTRPSAANSFILLSQEKQVWVTSLLNETATVSPLPGSSLQHSPRNTRSRMLSPTLYHLLHRLAPPPTHTHTHINKWTNVKSPTSFVNGVNLKIRCEESSSSSRQGLHALL